MSDIPVRKVVDEKIIGLLRTTALFGTLDESALIDIAVAANPVQLMGGMKLMQEGDPADSFYLVISGRISTFVTRDGIETPLGEAGRGELVGETSVLTGESQPVSARAIRDSVLLEFSKDAFYRLGERHPAAVFSLSQNIASLYQPDT